MVGTLLPFCIDEKWYTYICTYVCAYYILGKYLNWGGLGSKYSMCKV